MYEEFIWDLDDADLEDEPVIDTYESWAEFEAEVRRDQDGDKWRELLHNRG